MPADIPSYTKKELQDGLSKGGSLLPSGWLQPEDEKIYLTQSTEWKVLKTLHQTFHLGIENTYQMAKSIFAGNGLLKTIEQITKTCEICQRNNPNRKAAPPGLQRTGRYPGEDWQIFHTYAKGKKIPVYSCVDRYIHRMG